MAKFTVFYKDNLLSSARFESGVVHIGRDESNDLSIDSLAFAPAHAAVILPKSCKHYTRQTQKPYIKQ